MKRFAHIFSLALAALMLTACPEVDPGGQGGTDSPDDSWKKQASSTKLAGTTYQLNVYSFADTFSGCLGLTGEIPHDLFASNPSVTNFDHTFGSCRNLTGSIPYDLFSLHPRVTTFWGTFQDCIGLTGEIPSNLFANNPSVTNFAHTFMGCTGFSGDAPALWTTHPSASGRECFKDCSGLQNYDEIPSGWK